MTCSLGRRRMVRRPCAAQKPGSSELQRESGRGNARTAVEGARHGSGALDRLEHLEGGGVLGDVMDAENGGAARERHEVGGERAD
jgi:hypothetical protein